MRKHLIVVSVDALVFEDLEYARTLPNFARLLDGCAMIERVETIYPSVTHPVHATILTGAPAGVTGIVNNSIFKSHSPDLDNKQWYNCLSEIKCDTILHAAKRAGLTTAVSTWPVTADGGDVVDYLVPSALNYYFDGRDADYMDVYREHGAREELMDIIALAVERYGYRDRHPEYDQFQIFCAAEIFKRYRPNLLLTHPSDVDSKRHRGGVFGESVKEALRNTDEWLGILLDAVKETGLEDQTDFVVLSDHGQINISRVISPNVYLVDRGYITLSEDGSIKEWRAYVKSTGASAQVYLQDPDDTALKNELYQMLSEMANEGIYGFERVFTAKEAKALYGLSGDFSFVLETDGYTGFGERLVRPVVSGFDLNDYRFGKGTHGHAPHKGPQPTFFAKGPSFKSGVVLPKGNILNHAPTLAAVLGVELRDAVGTPVKEILTEWKGKN